MAIIVLLTLGAFSLIIYYFHRERLDRLRSEYEALAERHALTEHFEYLTKYANDIIIVLDDSWNIIEANDRAISSYGYSLGELLRIDYGRLIESPSREIVARRRQALERGESLLIEETHKRKDGSIFPAEASIRPIVSHGITYYQYIIRDITERKTAERLLYDRNQHLAMIINSAPVGIYDLDLDGRIKSIWNPAAEKLFGWKREEVLGKFLPTVPEQSMSEYEALHSITMQGESLTDVALERQRKGGSPVAISLSVSPLHDQQGNITGMLSIAVDMTKRKEMEKQLRLLNLTLEQKVAERTSRLRNINEELEAFSYSVSHDLRAPLRSIDGFSQAVMEDYEDKLDASGRDHLKRIRAATQRMGLLIDDLLQLSRITRVDMRTVEINLSSLASTAARETEEQTKRRIAWKIPEGLSATGDPRLLTIVLRNLFDNAVKFTAAKENPTIEFGRTVMNGTSWFYVRDNGVGFDPKYKDKLFTAFQRLHSAKDYPGTGIGLATVKRIIGRHGGEVWADGAIDAGAAFFFTIPGGRTEEQECMQ
ncbi:MAG: PAS domain S-box protein [Deltaproteobacteria bacterium]|nr:PAS domain S-box protein [Deltaproteobacteria bacterium]